MFGRRCCSWFALPRHDCDLHVSVGQLTGEVTELFDVAAGGERRVKYWGIRDNTYSLAGW